ncbi:hypothetical protein SAMN03159341_13715 [Paenibacillus sp. 1_12]|nr:hypothetical protein SAMN03159341_13715 [Paenibacillus sp. 1_12]
MFLDMACKQDRETRIRAIPVFLCASRRMSSEGKTRMGVYVYIRIAIKSSSKYLPLLFIAFRSVPYVVKPTDS